MKKDIHPNYNTAAKVICVCGNVISTGSIKTEIKTELCSKCHPFFTGKQKLVDAARRVEKFRERVSAQEEVAKTRKGKTVKRAELAKKKAKKEDSEK